MATVTPNFNWPVPTSTDLVKDGATAIEALGDSIDASLVDLKGGTTGQVLSKTSNTDMDFTWVAADDTNAIQNTIVDAKGDLIAASAADTPARLAVGANGETLVADSSTATGLRWQADYNIGRNKIINGFFDFWQRGTSFTAGALAYNADRFWSYQDGSGVATISRQTFSPQDDQDYFYRYSLSSLGTTTVAQIGTKIENVSTLAGKTATFSNYIKADSSRSNLITVFAEQNFGSGGSASVYTNLGTFSVTNAFTRPTLTTSIPSVSGKTIGAGSYLSIYFQFTPATSLVLDTYAWQLEEGSVATRAVRCAGTIQGELAACQRYYYRAGGDQTTNPYGQGFGSSSTAAGILLTHPVSMRVAPSVLDYSLLWLADHSATTVVTSLAINANWSGKTTTMVVATVASGLTTNRPYFLLAQGTLSSYVGFSAEL